MRPYGTWPAAHEKKDQKLVFIGRDMSVAAMDKALSSCLLTAAELDLDAAAWAPFVDMWLPRLDTSSGLCIGHL